MSVIGLRGQCDIITLHLAPSDSPLSVIRLKGHCDLITLHRALR